MRYWIKAVILVIGITIITSTGLDGIIHYVGSINSANDISSSTTNITEPIGILIASFVLLRFKPTNDNDILHYNLIRKILMVVIPVSAAYGLGNEFLRAYGPYVSPFLVIFVLYTKNIVMILTIIFVYQKYKSQLKVNDKQE
jgi:hypothetical protein